VVEVLDQAKAARGAPEYIRMDNGPELVANAIRDWCRLSGTWHPLHRAGPPLGEPIVESFNARRRDELFNREIFHSVFEAKVLYFDWCDVDNNFRPPRSIGYLAPAMFAALLLGQLPKPELQTR
jgi:putative transposase